MKKIINAIPDIVTEMLDGVVAAHGETLRRLEGWNVIVRREIRPGKVTLLSVTEGDDKPEKYPLMFHISAAMLLNKVDLLPYVDFDMERAGRHARTLNADIALFPVSARTGEGLAAWYDWLRARLAAKRGK